MSRLRWRVPRGDRGDTLVELLMTVMIMSVAIAVILGSIAATIRFTDIHRKQAVAGAEVRRFAEQIEVSVAAPTTGYKTCAGKADYEPLYSAPTGYGREVVTVSFWDAVNKKFVGACGTDPGVQRVTVHVWSVDNRGDEKLDVILRRPCRLADTTC